MPESESSDTAEAIIARVDGWAERALQELDRVERGSNLADNDQIGTVTSLVDEFHRWVRDEGRASDPVGRRRHLETQLQISSPVRVTRLLRSFAYQPATVVRTLVPALGLLGWSTLVDLYEVLVLLAGHRTMTSVPAGVQRTAAGYLTRTRWVLYVALFEPHATGPPVPVDRELSDGLFGDVVVAASQARADWLAVLDHLEDNPDLAHVLDPAHEARTILRYSLPASASGAVRSNAPEQSTEVDRDVWRECVRRHLLPRFAITDAWRLAWRLAPRRGRAAMAMAVLLEGGAAILIGVGLAIGRPLLLPVAVAIGVPTGILVVGATATEPCTSWPWLIRQPASAAVALFALVTSSTAWWHQAHRMTPVLVASASMAVFAVGYLTIQALNHGCRGRQVLRVLPVAGMGIFHAWMVATTGIVIFLPAFVEHGGDFTACWTTERCSSTMPLPAIVVAVTAWCFSAGVFIQLLWDHQPLTAPLAQHRWRAQP